MSASTEIGEVTTVREILTTLGDRAVRCDLYDELGSAMYHDITLADDSEIRELLSLLRGLGVDSVIELAAGAGRLTLPLVASGRRVVGLDLSPSLLRVLEERALDLVMPARERLTTVLGTMADFHLGAHADAVVLGSTSITLLSTTDRQGLYRCVAEHLAPGGCFIVTVPVPQDDVAQIEEIHRVVPGWSGRRYDMFDSVSPGEAHRLVTVVPHDSTDPLVPVAQSRPLLFDGALVGDELRELGWLLVAERELGDCTDRLDARIQAWRAEA